MVEIKFTEEEKKNLLAALDYVVADLNKTADNVIKKYGRETYEKSSIPKIQIKYDLLQLKIYRA